MKFLTSSFILMICFGSCAPSEAYVNQLIHIQDCAAAELENQTKAMFYEVKNRSDENPDKFLAAFKMIQSALVRYEILKKHKVISKTEFLSFKEFLASTLESVSEEEWQKEPLNPADDFYRGNSELQQSSLILACATLMQYFTNSVYSGYDGFRLRFIQLVDIEIGFSEDDYSFALLSSELQHLMNRNYQIDSILFNGRHHYFQNKILPNVCANVCITTESAGSYEVYGHMNYTAFSSVDSLPFYHEFTKKASKE